MYIYGFLMPYVIEYTCDESDIYRYNIEIKALQVQTSLYRH